MWSESVVLAVACDHRVASVERLRWSDLRGERFIVSVQEPGPEIYDWLTARIGGLGETTDIVRCQVARETLFVKVALGLGLSVVSEAGAVVIYPNVVFKTIGDPDDVLPFSVVWAPEADNRSEEHTSELQAIRRISYDVLCLKNKINHQH